MGERNFRQLLEGRWELGNFLCVGLDSEPEKIPQSARKATVRDTIFSFNKQIIDATHDIVCAFKPNSAFYEAHGDGGLLALSDTVSYIHKVASDVPVILDAKRADIGNTNDGYVEAVFDRLGMDALTVHPYLGREALEPFLARSEKGIIVLCKTSNPGAGEFQDMLVDGEPLYKIVAKHVSEKWNKNGNCGLVVGATYPDDLKKVRAIVGDMPILIPGIGAQGGDLERAVLAGKNSRGRGMIISVSRAVLFASDGSGFAGAAREKAIELDSAIRKAI
ncbi:MAG: orotidine-5'-phosphate decarboxylase [Patescibacteria group bacterium]